MTKYIDWEHFMRASLQSIAAAGFILCSHSAFAAGSALEGRLTQITMHEATLNYTKSFAFDPKQAQCFDPRGYKITCETLVGVGYADKVRLTVSGNVVQRIDIIDLQQ